MAQAISNRAERRNNGVTLMKKIFRTSAFIMILFGAVVLAVTTLIAIRPALGSTVDAYEEYIVIMEKTLADIGITDLLFYAQLSLLLGLLVLAWTVGNNPITKVLHTIGLLFVLLYLVYNPDHSYILKPVVNNVPDWVTKLGDSNRGYFEQFDTLLTNFPELMGGIVTSVYAIMASASLKQSRPKRLSIGFVKFGVSWVAFSTIVFGLLVPFAAQNIEFVQNFTTQPMYLAIFYVPLIINLLFMTIGSLIGSIFFFVK